MNEHSFVRSIHRKLPGEIYTWKINDNYAGGVADAYYSSDGGDLWIEYKYLKTLPAKGSTEIEIGLSGNQKIWLGGRFKEGRVVAVVVGSPEGNLILQHPDDWLRKIPKHEFISKAIETPEIVSYITRITTRK